MNPNLVSFFVGDSQSQPFSVGRKPRKAIGSWGLDYGFRLTRFIHPLDRPPCRLAAPEEERAIRADIEGIDIFQQRERGACWFLAFRIEGKGLQNRAIVKIENVANRQILRSRPENPRNRFSLFAVQWQDGQWPARNENRFPPGQEGRVTAASGNELRGAAGGGYPRQTGISQLRNDLAVVAPTRPSIDFYQTIGDSDGQTALDRYLFQLVVRRIADPFAIRGEERET
jgi:hypothetical protein